MKTKNMDVIQLFVDYIPNHAVKELIEKYDHLIMGNNLYIVRYYELYAYDILIAYYNKQEKTFFITNQKDLSKTIRKHINKVVSAVKNLVKINSDFSLDKSMDLSNFVIENFDCWR